jgi:hypothetical protein
LHIVIERRESVNIRPIGFFGFRAWIVCTAALLISWSFFAFDAEPQASSGARTAPAKEVFLKAFYALDEPRFHCVDIQGIAPASMLPALSWFTPARRAFGTGTKFSISPQSQTGN